MLRGRARRPRGGSRGASGPSSRHLAEHGDRARPRLEGGEVVERRAHRDRVGVVAVVDRGRSRRRARRRSPRRREKPIPAAPARPSPPSGSPSATPAAIAARALVRLWASAKGKLEALLARRASRPAPRSRPSPTRDLARLDVAAGAEAQQPLGARSRCGSSSPGLGRDDRGAAVGAAPSSISALAAAIASTEPSSSTWTGPTLVITATSGSAISASSAIWPAPRIAISSTSASVSVGRLEHGQRQPDLGVEVLAGWRGPGRAGAPGQMSLTEVLPVEPVIPTTGRRARAARRGRAPAAPPAGRRRRRPSRRRRRPSLAPRRARRRAGADDDAPGAGLERRRRRTRRRRGCSPRRPKKRSPAPTSRGVDHRPRGGRRRRPRRAPRRPSRGGDLARPSSVDHAGARRELAQLLAGDLAVVEGDLPPALELLALLVALAGDHDGVAGLGAAPSASAIAARRSTSTSTSAPALAIPATIFGDDRLRVLGARVVGGDDRQVGELGPGPAHQRPLVAVAVAAGAEDRDQPARRSAAAPRAARSPASPACGRSRPGRRTPGPRRSARSGPAPAPPAPAPRRRPRGVDPERRGRGEARRARSRR